MQSKISLGIIGEDAAVNFLRKKGFKIIERNFKIRYGEIDIIASSKDCLVFIEVKTRSSHEFGTPFEAITYWKLQSVIKTAQFYSMAHPKLPKLMRIDAVAVELLPGGIVGDIKHIENISGF